MKLLTALIIFLIQLQSQAASRVKYLPGDSSMVINVTEKDIYGNIDTDYIDLYHVMNVPEQDSSMGKGKSIVSTGRDLNIVCGKDKKLCTIIIRKSANTEISAGRKYASFKIAEVEAAALTKKFKLNDKGEAYFQSVDKIFKVVGTADSFIFETSGE